MLCAIEDKEAAGWTLTLEQTRKCLGTRVPPCHATRVAIVVVNPDDVRGYALPAIITDNGPGRIERLREVVKRSNVVTFGGIRGQVRHAPRFVDRHPCADAWVAAVPFDRRRPLLGQTVHRVLGKAIR